MPVDVLDRAARLLGKISGITPGTAATDLGKAEDAAHTSGDTGVMALAVRKNTAAGLGADGDYVPLIVDENGKLWIHSDVAGYAEDAAHVSGDLGTMALAVRADTAAATAANGDYVPLLVDASGRLWASVNVISGGIASGAIASGAVASGAIASGAVASGAVVDGAVVTLGAKADAKSTATDTTAVSLQQVAKQISYSAQVLEAAITALGQATMAASVPVVLPSNFTDGTYIGDIKFGEALPAGTNYIGDVSNYDQLITLASSAARTSSGNGTAVESLGGHRRYIIVCDITASATAAGDTLDVYVDVSPDGTNWVNAVHFTQQAGDGAARKEVAILDPANPGTSVIDVTADAAAGATRPALFGQKMRARWAIVDGGGADTSHTFSVVALAQ